MNAADWQQEGEGGGGGGGAQGGAWMHRSANVNDDKCSRKC